MADLHDRLLGPNEWGYRCPVEGGFIEDDAPFDAAAALAWIAGVCREEMSMTYNEAMRQILLRNIADVAEKGLMPETTPTHVQTESEI